MSAGRSPAATRALWYVAPGAAEIREQSLAPLAADEVEVAVEHSLISRGTERLVWEGRVPPGEWQRMRAPMQEGDFPFPVKYGYAAVGRVTDGPAPAIGRRVFALAPHQTVLRLPWARVLPVPEGVPAARAALAANMETALNAIWDARLPPGARVLVVGMGLLGCLVAALLSRRRDLGVVTTDTLPDRERVARDFCVSFVAPPEVTPDHDVAFHTSASGAGLATALSGLRFEGEVIELSWYGDREVSVPLGGPFHSRRLAIRSSQVGHVAPSRRAALTHRDRLAAALEKLADERLASLISTRVKFDDMPAALSRLLAPGATGIATLVDY